MKFSQQKRSLKENTSYFLKWTAISCLLGCVGGLAGCVFAKCVSFVTDFRVNHSWMLYLMPVAGVMIVFMYQIFHEEKNRGTNGVLEALASQKQITLATGPLIFISTVLTHLVGGSSGREGAALQLGGCLGTIISRALKFNTRDRQTALMCGMSAVFGAMFGTPAAAGIFSLEVVNIGVMHYAALFPSVFAAFIGARIASWMGVAGERFRILDMPEFGLAGAGYMVLLGILCALVSIGFCTLLHRAEKLYQKKFPNPYLRIVAASVIFIAITLLSGTRVYNGSSMQLIEEAMEGHVAYEAFLLKAFFTAVALGGGFKGGEIVPTLCVGAAFGCTVGQVLGISPSLFAACGMAALFVGVTNCPVATLIIALEMFGGEGLPYFAIIIAVSFAMSGYYSLYSSQNFACPKTEQD